MTSTIDLDTLLATLPACRRCRKNRRRCDTKLPSCANCNKAGVECIFYDHTLQEELPRSYIASLVEHLTREETEAQVSTSSAASSSTLSTTDSVEARHHFGYAQGAYRYIGEGSHLLDVSIEPSIPSQKRRQAPPPEIPAQVNAVPNSIPHDLRTHLTNVFFNTINQVYPVLDKSSMISVSEPKPATQEFVQEMVCAVACRFENENRETSTSSSHDQMQRLHSLGVVCHEKALRHIEQATAAQAVSTLQVVVLLVLYTLVCPSTGGNISQQLGFAIRLVIDLCESGSDSDDDNEGAKAPPLSSLYKVIYCLENHVCGVLVRPTALPEPTDPLIMPSFSEHMSRLSSPTSSDVDNSLNLLCTLYRVQARYRNGSLTSVSSGHDTLGRSVLEFADRFYEYEAHRRRTQSEEFSQVLHPNVAAVLNETCLVLDSSSVDAATRVLNAHCSPDYLATFLSSYWVHRAGIVIVDALLGGAGSSQLQLIRAYGQAVTLLTSWETTWDSAGVLRQALEQRLVGRGPDGE